MLNTDYSSQTVYNRTVRV